MKGMRMMIKKCSLCHIELDLGTSIVWHFISKHPDVIFLNLEESHPETYSALSKTIRTNYVTIESIDYNISDSLSSK